MKAIAIFVFCICMVVTSNLGAQTTSKSNRAKNNKTDTAAIAEQNKNQYKSKQWRQGTVTPEDLKTEGKTKPGAGTKSRKSRKTPPAPVPLQPPTGLPPTK